eukprot:COSAG02_NODE_46778_length_346_cov_0.785425_1_plen_51_part_01
MLNLAVTRVLSTIEMLDVAGQVAFCLANARRQAFSESAKRRSVRFREMHNL